MMLAVYFGSELEFIGTPTDVCKYLKEFGYSIHPKYILEHLGNHRYDGLTIVECYHDEDIFDDIA